LIGGYIYRHIDTELDQRIRRQLDAGMHCEMIPEAGYFFHDEPYAGSKTLLFSSDGLTVLTQDLLVECGPEGEYAVAGVGEGFARRFATEGMPLLDRLSSDFRMALMNARGDGSTLFLVSHRAGAGRMYFHRLEAGILFCSDLRFLLRILPADIDERALYAILKYGAVPEPMTISRNVSAVPASHYLRYELPLNRHSLHSYFRFAFDDVRAAPTEDLEGALQPVKAVLQKSARFLRACDPVLLLSGGVDSSLFGCYLHEAGGGPIRAAHCSFGAGDTELEHARAIARRIDADFNVGEMKGEAAWTILQEAVSLSDHPFSDFSTLPVVFILKFIREHLGESGPVIECNGGDDCFGFPALGERGKYAVKAHVPKLLKRAISTMLQGSACWRLQSHEGMWARLAALADVHEVDSANYFLVLAPVHYLGMENCARWDGEITALMGQVFQEAAENYGSLSYEAATTVRQLLHVNSRRWAAKALSVEEDLGIRCVYPFIWREVLVEQGRLPWNAKIHDGVVKWPLKRLLEEYMPPDFIYRKKSGFVPPFATWLGTGEFARHVRESLIARDSMAMRVASRKVMESLLADASAGETLRPSVLNFLWGALFTELWLSAHAKT
jgi:asparagine synthase (glutamine-hydrolysing)